MDKMFSTININFQGSPYKVYFTGQTVLGTVEISFAKVKRVRGISFQIYGYARTRWDAGKDKCHANYTYSGRENYLLSKKYLIGSDLDSARNIEPGSYSYNFSCTLPKRLPSSFEGKHGHIRYLAKVVLERPWKFDQTYTVGFTVLRPLDLNLESPLIRIPSEVEVLQQFWCSICTSKPIHIKGKLPQAGFVPGQVIPLQAEVNNASNVDIKAVRIRLQCIISYQADTPQLHCQEEIVDIVCKNHDPVLKNSTANFETNITVPSVPSSSNSTYSKIIQISYCIRIEAVTTPYLHKNAYVLFPITIGTVPFIQGREQGAQEDDASINRWDETNYAAAIDGNVLPILSPLRDLELLSEYNIAPPSYEEAVTATRVQVDADESHPIERTEFVPRYPVYQFEPTRNKNEEAVVKAME